MIQVQHLHNTGTCYGGHVVTEDSAFAAKCKLVPVDS